MKSQNIEYVPAIDHMRGYAALLIILYHGLHQFSYLERFGRPFEFNNWLPTSIMPLAILVEGHTAVAFFMVLSGFIFTYGAYGKDIVYWRFIYNRFLRTYPLFIFLILVGIYAFPEKYSFESLLQTLSFLNNAPDTLNIKSFSSMFWAIAVEWQFYLIFPFCIAFYAKFGKKYLLGIIVLFTIFRIIACLEGANPRDLSYWTIVGRIDQFILGMIVAIIYHTYEFGKKWSYVIFITSFILLMCSLYIFHMKGGWLSVSFYKIFWPTWEGFLWAAIIPSYIVISAHLPRMLSKSLSHVGLLSYSMYLTHFIVISIFVHYRYVYDFGIGIKGNALANTVVFALPLIIGLSVLTYTMVEKPFLNMRISYFRKERTERKMKDVDYVKDITQHIN